MGFKASLDILAKIITIGVILLLAVLGSNSTRVLLNMNNPDLQGILIHSGILIFFLAIIIGSYMFSPRKYILNEDQLIIERPVSLVVFALDDITEVTNVDSGKFIGTIRTFGVGGLFGYFGRFYNKNFGHFTCYITQRKNLIFIKTKTGKKIFISPDDVNMGVYLRTYLLSRSSVEI